MRKPIYMMLVVLGTFFICASAFAASPWTEQTTWSGKATYKLDFGMKNLLAGWTEIITEPYEAHKEGGNCAKAFLVGIGNAVADTLGGVLHIATFPITNLDVPLPENGVSI